MRTKKMVSMRLPEDVRELLAQVPMGKRSAFVSSAVRSWADLLPRLAAGGVPMAIHAGVQAVIQQYATGASQAGVPVQTASDAMALVLAQMTTLQNGSKGAGVALLSDFMATGALSPELMGWVRAEIAGMDGDATIIPFPERAAAVH